MFTAVSTGKKAAFSQKEKEAGSASNISICLFSSYPHSSEANEEILLVIFVIFTTKVGLDIWQDPPIGAVADDEKPWYHQPRHKSHT